MDDILGIVALLDRHPPALVGAVGAGVYFVTDGSLTAALLAVLVTLAPLALGAIVAVGRHDDSDDVAPAIRERDLAPRARRNLADLTLLLDI